LFGSRPLCNRRIGLVKADRHDRQVLAALPIGQLLQVR
jgi:hypothetical protein